MEQMKQMKIEIVENKLPKLCPRKNAPTWIGLQHQSAKELQITPKNPPPNFPNGPQDPPKPSQILPKPTQNRPKIDPNRLLEPNLDQCYQMYRL